MTMGFRLTSAWERSMSKATSCFTAKTRKCGAWGEVGLLLLLAGWQKQGDIVCFHIRAGLLADGWLSLLLAGWRKQGDIPPSL